MSFANNDVLNFYKELPFNYGDKVEDHADRIMANDLTTAYPILAPLLRERPKVFEVGCGVGWLSCAIAHHWRCEVNAIDFNPVVIERARAIAHHMRLSVNLRAADLFTFEPDAPADLVISLGVLHHTNNCHEAIRRCAAIFTKPGGHFLLGLYHSFGRRPFLSHFEEMKRTGASENDMFEEYGRLHHWLGDQKQLYSWFRDQVLHPHETQHTLKEVVTLGEECGLELISTSINRFATIENLDVIYAMEESYEATSKKRLSLGQYFPGFFVALFKKR